MAEWTGSNGEGLWLALCKHMPWDWLQRHRMRIAATLATPRAEAELRSLNAHELRDLGLDRGGIAYAVRHGRKEMGVGNSGGQEALPRANPGVGYPVALACMHPQRSDAAQAHFRDRPPA